MVRWVGGTELTRAAERTGRQGGREGKVGGDCCNPKGSGQPVERGGAWGLWLLKLPPDVTVQLLQFRVHVKGRQPKEGRAFEGRQGKGEAERVGEGLVVGTVKGFGRAPSSVGLVITWQGATMGPTCLRKSPSARRLWLRSGLLMLWVHLCGWEREEEKERTIERRKRDEGRGRVVGWWAVSRAGMPLLELTALCFREGQLPLRPACSCETGNPVHREFSPHLPADRQTGGAWTQPAGSQGKELGGIWGVAF